MRSTVPLSLQVQTELSFVCLRKNQGWAILLIMHPPALETDYYSRSTTFANFQSSNTFQNNQININMWVNNENVLRILIFMNTLWAGDVSDRINMCATSNSCHTTTEFPRQGRNDGWKRESSCSSEAFHILFINVYLFKVVWNVFKKCRHIFFTCIFS